MIHDPAFARKKRVSTEVTFTEDGRLYYHGNLDLEANQKLFTLYEQSHPKPKILQITSGGGDTMLGLDLGEWIFAKQLDVEVVRYCASSCANYIFTAGKRKILRPDSIVFWHGGAHQKDLESLAKRQGPEALAHFRAWRDREDLFFKTIGINGKITTYGQSKHFNRFWSGYWGRAGFDYSVEDMKKFGISHIIEEGGRWDWRRFHSQPVVKRVHVKNL